MGGHPYWYTIPYNPDPQEALDALREREFQAGRYNPVIPFLRFPITAASPAPGAQHDSIEDALEEADADGTRSILDIAEVSEEPDFGVAAPLAPEVLTDLYGSTQPSRDDVEANMEFLEEIERGQACYFALYRNGKPEEWLFAGYSFD